MATNDLHFTVSTNGVEDTTNYHDSPAAPGGIPPANQQDWGRLSQSAHPFVIIFHLLFKSLALLMYLFGGWFSKAKNGGSAGANFIVVTVICIFLLSADFWTVKNVTGRLLVGLRWWNKVENDQTSWIFESAKNRQVNAFDKSVFWTVLYAAPVVWGVLGFFAILRFQFSWLIICGTALALSGANVYGYYKCSSEQKARFEQMMQDGAQAGAMAMFQNSASSMQNSVMGFVTKAAAGGGTQQQNQQPVEATFT
mmetsp:Transcript_365/g.535  ORF Transcript_365/g.535 Transcript_365/m.535 type:complete len:253 (+) Transcript_365:120-878(+)|eukprot:CAMPEP_0113627250 /NCGR_PEP_ID=MMETSP0017_2-20120614/14107_1 /TAXON_ID=2856 /ORGANISM="Cylindrotheca closterium" /LENGTH=252 /DNA_ID=CAMNT_0000537487 /DNA_START=109 /DNA_END=867 /DNA_ORIENTATION=- /assembly_acc=CAM_ASM_000147